MLMSQTGQTGKLLVPLTGQITRPGEDPTGASARRGAAWMWPKEGWYAQHGARERREVSLVEITTGVHRGAGGTWGTKKIPPNWPWM
jgi:hypothetical protein